jgi:hypothetical protein
MKERSRTWKRRPFGFHTVASVSYELRNIFSDGRR